MIAALLSLALAAAPPAPQGVYELPPAEFVQQAKADAALLRRYSAGLERLRPEVAELGRLLAAGKEKTFSPEEKQQLLSSWAVLYDYVLSTELVRQRYWDYFLAPPADAVRHGWGFALTHAALTLELAHGLAFADLALGHQQAETLLNEAAPALGLPAGSFARFREKVVHVSTTAQLFAGDAYAKQLQQTWSKAKLLDDPDGLWLVQQLRRNAEAARAKLKARGVRVFAEAAAGIARDAAAQAIFPLQKNVAEWMGDTRVYREGKPLVTREQAAALLEKMLPGDIVVVRQNWFLSNVGLPGFWPHAELYLGRPQELAAYFDAEPEATAFARAQPEHADRFSELLARRFPEKWKRYGGNDFVHGEPILVIEAISEGVSFTGLQHALMTDYLGVMRPRRSKLEKAQAVLRAFEYQGRPYDFDFDFFSDATLVCTELVYKSYAPSKGMLGLRIPLVRVAGRMTLPANELVRLFDVEHGREDRQLDFVAFLDGSEAGKAAVEGDEESFRKSYQRVKWDIAQQ